MVGKHSHHRKKGLKNLGRVHTIYMGLTICLIFEWSVINLRSEGYCDRCKHPKGRVTPCDITSTWVKPNQVNRGGR